MIPEVKATELKNNGYTFITAEFLIGSLNKFWLLIRMDVAGQVWYESEAQLRRPFMNALELVE